MRGLKDNKTPGLPGVELTCILQFEKATQFKPNFFFMDLMKEVNHMKSFALSRVYFRELSNKT